MKYIRKEKTMKKKHGYILLLVTLIFLVSCGGKEPAQDSTSHDPAAYPVQEGESSYPINQPDTEEESGYPISEKESAYPQGPEFSFDTPVAAGDDFVTGIGPADVPIKLIDVSEVGLMLSETLIDNDGVFKFTLEEQLVSGHTIGIQLGDLENTEFSEGDFREGINLDDNRMVGILFDILVVE